MSSLMGLTHGTMQRNLGRDKLLGPAINSTITLQIEEFCDKHLGDPNLSALQLAIDTLRNKTPARPHLAGVAVTEEKTKRKREEFFGRGRPLLEELL